MIISKLIVELLIGALFIDVFRRNDNNHFIKKTNGQFVGIDNLDNDDLIMLFGIWFTVSLFIWFI